MAMFMANQLHILINQGALHRERVLRDREHPLDQWMTMQCTQKHSFTHLGCIKIIDLLQDQLEHPTNRNHAYHLAFKCLLLFVFMDTGLYSMIAVQHLTILSFQQLRIICYIKWPRPYWYQNTFTKFPSGKRKRMNGINRTICVIIDACHMIKLLRNTLTSVRSIKTSFWFVRRANHTPTQNNAAPYSLDAHKIMYTSY